MENEVNGDSFFSFDAPVDEMEDDGTAHSRGTLVNDDALIALVVPFVPVLLLFIPWLLLLFLEGKLVCKLRKREEKEDIVDKEDDTVEEFVNSGDALSFGGNGGGEGTEGETDIPTGTVGFVGVKL